MGRHRDAVHHNGAPGQQGNGREVLCIRNARADRSRLDSVVCAKRLARHTQSGFHSCENRSGGSRARSGCRSRCRSWSSSSRSLKPSPRATPLSGDKTRRDDVGAAARRAEIDLVVVRAAVRRVGAGPTEERILGKRRPPGCCRPRRRSADGCHHRPRACRRHDGRPGRLSRRGRACSGRNGRGATRPIWAKRPYAAISGVSLPRPRIDHRDSAPRAASHDPGPGVRTAAVHRRCVFRSRGADAALSRAPRSQPRSSSPARRSASHSRLRRDASRRSWSSRHPRGSP